MVFVIFVIVDLLIESTGHGQIESARYRTVNTIMTKNTSTLRFQNSELFNFYYL